LKRFQHAPGVCKIDYALSETIPWESAECRRAGTLHLGGTLDVLGRRVGWDHKTAFIMTSRGAVSPSHHSNESAPCSISIARPSIA